MTEGTKLSCFLLLFISAYQSTKQNKIRPKQKNKKCKNPCCLYREDYDSWERAGNPGWGWDSVLKYYIKSEVTITLKDGLKFF